MELATIAFLQKLQSAQVKIKSMPSKQKQKVEMIDQLKNMIDVPHGHLGYLSVAM